MGKVIGTAAVLLALALGAAAQPDGGTLAGLWLTEDGDGVIQLAPCGAAMCGRIVGFEGGVSPRDWQGRPECGLQISRVTERQPGRWRGTITDPRNGTVYDVLMSADGAHLRLRGFVIVPLLGQTQLWTRYTGQLTPDCRMQH